MVEDCKLVVQMICREGEKELYCGVNFGKAMLHFIDGVGQIIFTGSSELSNTQI